MSKRNPKWTREELVVAFNLYCKIPFGRIHIRNPEIIILAKALGRTPSSLSWKLANFARLDPALQQRNIAGASHGSKGEVEVWEEFNGNWEVLAFESERLLAEITGRKLSQIAKIVEEELPQEGKERERMVRVRVNQHFFRATVLSAYDNRCCITGLSIPDLLNASHIIPWSVDQRNRLNPRNGLALNAVHDRAFDRGLITVTPAFKVKVSTKLSRLQSDSAVEDFFLRYDGVDISPPSRFSPDPSFLNYHNKQVFQE